MTDHPPVDVLEQLLDDVVGPAAGDVDATGQFPHASISALANAGVLGTLSHADVGGRGGSLAEAAQIVRRLASRCGSTAMVVCMHFSATAVIEAYGPQEVRRAIASGRHLSTLAFSETGSRSHFWAPLGTAERNGDDVLLTGSKSWVTSACHADSYVWSSRSVAQAAGATLWLVPAATAGIHVGGSFDGLGLRGNDSRPVLAERARLPISARLGDDGSGLDIALGAALPVFQILNASCSLGLMDAAVAKAVQHATTTKLAHLDQTLAQQPVTRSHVAQMVNRADSASAVVDDAIAALAAGRADAPLRMLQSKAIAGDAALTVLDAAMQIGGGAAFRKEIGIERHFRDGRAAAVMAPTGDALREFIGRAVCGMPLFD